MEDENGKLMLGLESCPKQPKMGKENPTIENIDNFEPVQEMEEISDLEEENPYRPLEGEAFNDTFAIKLIRLSGLNLLKTRSDSSPRVFTSQKIIKRKGKRLPGKPYCFHLLGKHQKILNLENY